MIDKVEVGAKYKYSDLYLSKYKHDDVKRKTFAEIIYTAKDEITLVSDCKQVTLVGIIWNRLIIFQ